jgi:hypothetical protein
MLGVGRPHPRAPAFDLSPIATRGEKQRLCERIVPASAMVIAAGARLEAPSALSVLLWRGCGDCIRFTQGNLYGL